MATRKTPIYTIGYSGRTADDIKRIVGGGLLLDIRFSPRSRKAGFSQKKLEENFNDQYQWLYEFGNENFRGNTILLYDPAAGLEIIKTLSEKYHDMPLFLMCACANPTTCHRATVATLLRKHGYEVTEYKDPT